MATAVRHPAAPAAFDRRRVERQAVAVTCATVGGDGELRAPATLVDLSIYGCRLAIDAPPAPGARLWLRLDGAWPVAAAVVWVDAGRIGCRFDEPLPNALTRRFTRALAR